MIKLTYQAALLLLIAAAVHAAWNFAGKSQRATPAVFLVANTLGTFALFLPISFIAPARELFFSDSFPPNIWGWVVLTGLFQALYYLGLAGAYRTGDLSLAYPLLRAVPVVLVLFANLLLGRSEQISLLAVWGMIFVAVGALLLPLKHFKDWNWRRWFIPAVGWALFAAVNTVGYSLVDDHALRILRISSGSALDVTLVYAFWEGLAASFWLGLLILPVVKSRARLTEVLCTGLPQAALTGLGVYLAYTLVLIAMGYVQNVSYVVAFRQTSILFGALLGLLVLKEPHYPPRIVGVGVLFLGLVMVGLG